jgi:H+/Cl- antiporter ClcA
MGGSVAGVFAKAASLRPEDRRTALMAGVAGGFGAVFGTPLAGAVFAAEILAVGTIRYDSLVPCLTAGLFSDWICRLWGARHTDYRIAGLAPEHFDAVLACKVAAATVAFGLAAALYVELAHALHRLFERIRSPLLRPVLGAAAVITLVYVLGTRDFLGLGVSSTDPNAVTILASFRDGGAHAWSWLWKMIFTALTLGSGFKGGEVTPLFYIGATLGNSLAHLLSAPVGLFAALGFVAVFAGATNTPLACTIMGVELFGSELLVPLAVACFVAYLFSGRAGLYLAQRQAQDGKLNRR